MTNQGKTRESSTNMVSQGKTSESVLYKHGQSGENLFRVLELLFLYWNNFSFFYYQISNFVALSIIPHWVNAHPTWPELTYPILPWPKPTWPDLTWPILSWPDLPWPDQTYSTLPWPDLPWSNLSWPDQTYLDLTWPDLTKPTLFGVLMCSW